MCGRLQGKVAVLTAAGAGIGRATAEAFIAQGARVIATDLRAESLTGLKGADCRALDVRSTEAVNSLALDVGPVDILFNCAGYVHHGSILDEVGLKIAFALAYSQYVGNVSICIIHKSSITLSLVKTPGPCS